MSYSKCYVCGRGYDPDYQEDILLHDECHQDFLENSVLFSPNEARRDNTLDNICLTVHCLDLMLLSARIDIYSNYHFENEMVTLSILFNHCTSTSPIEELEVLCSIGLAFKTCRNGEIVYRITQSGFKLLSRILNIQLRVSKRCLALEFARKRKDRIAEAISNLTTME